MGVQGNMELNEAADYLFDKLVDERLLRLETEKLVDKSIEIFKMHNETIELLTKQRDEWEARATGAEERASRLEAERDEWEERYRKAIRGELEC